MVYTQGTRYPPSTPSQVEEVGKVAKFFHGRQFPGSAVELACADKTWHKKAFISIYIHMYLYICISVSRYIYIYLHSDIDMNIYIYTSYIVYIWQYTIYTYTCGCVEVANWGKCADYRSPQELVHRWRWVLHTATAGLQIPLRHWGRSGRFVMPSIFVFCWNFRVGHNVPRNWLVSCSSVSYQAIMIQSWLCWLC
jgi:hypothetical protein